MSENAKRYVNKKNAIETAQEVDAHLYAKSVREGRKIIAEKAEKANLSVGEYLAQRADRQRARAMAETAGLAYWPALASGSPRIDPAAYVVAERIMVRGGGKLWGEWNEEGEGEMARGGWDRWGCYGLSPNQVACMWYAAGCRDGGKFRLQVRTGEVARKGESIQEFIHYVRGLRWLKQSAPQVGLNLSRKAIITLGRLSTPLRAAALSGVQPIYTIGPDGQWRLVVLRARHLNWEAVAVAQKATAPGDEGTELV